MEQSAQRVVTVVVTVRSKSSDSQVRVVVTFRSKSSNISSNSQVKA